MFLVDKFEKPAHRNQCNNIVYFTLVDKIVQCQLTESEMTKSRTHCTSYGQVRLDEIRLRQVYYWSFMLYAWQIWFLIEKTINELPYYLTSSSMLLYREWPKSKVTYVEGEGTSSRRGGILYTLYTCKQKKCDSQYCLSESLKLFQMIIEPPCFYTWMPKLELRRLEQVFETVQA